MKANRIPTAQRLRLRISALEIKEDAIWVKGSRGNPYHKCKSCGIHTPEFHVTDGYRHRKGCPHQGLLAEIAHYKGLLAEAATSNQTG